MMSSAPDAVVLAGATFDASESICARLDIAVTMRTEQTIKLSFRILRIAARLIVATLEIVRGAVSALHASGEQAMAIGAGKALSTIDEYLESGRAGKGWTCDAQRLWKSCGIARAMPETSNKKGCSDEHPS